MSIKVKFLGSGSAFVFAEENYQSNILFTKEVETQKVHESSQFTGDTTYQNVKESKHLLYDAGETCAEALKAQDMIPQDLDSIYISHLHGDHSGGIESIAFKTYFQVFNFGKSEFGSMKPNLLAHHSILRDGWDHSWSAGLQSIQGEVNTLESYFDTTYLQDNDSFDFYGTEMKPIQTVHVVDDRRMVPSYGMMFKENDTTAFLTGDTQFAPNQMLTYYAQSDIIFQDCEFAEYPGSVHAQFHQLCTLPLEIKRKMWLYHYSLGAKTYEELEEEAKDAGFAGLVKRGQEFVI
jgi:ribonuclease BN (tRNA processing enzyme)